MTFDSPAGLLLLGVLPVIVWLHLRRRWPRRRAVPSLVPWLALRSAAPPPRRVPPTALLALHLAAATLLALAAAGPRLPAAATDVLDRAVVLDVSTSMGAAERWPAAVAEARALIAATRGALTLVTLGPRPRVLVARGTEPRLAEAALQTLSPGGTSARTDEALALAAAVAGPEAEIVVVTDGAIPAPGPAAPPARWVRVGAPAENVAVVDAAARTTGGQTRLFASLASFGSSERSVALALNVDGRPWDERSVRLAAGENLDMVWTLPGGARTAEVRLDGRDAQPADDMAVVPLEGHARRVQLVAASESVVSRAMAALPDATVEAVGMGTYHTDGSADVSVFVGAVPELLPPGGVLLFNPPPGRLLDARVSGATATIDTLGDHPIVAGLDLAGAMLVGLTDPRVPEWGQAVLTVADRTAIVAGGVGQSRLVIFAFDPDGGTVSERLAFPILVARAADWVAPAAPPTVAAAGDVVQLGHSDLSIRTPAGRQVRSRGAFADTGDAGLYIAPALATAGDWTFRFAVRAGDPLESDLGLGQPADEPERPVGRAGAAPSGQRLGPPLAALALMVVLVEGLWRSLRAQQSGEAGRRK